ncbi:MAG TPA: TIGR03620 family F420-dependent LLM class oxidoreductase [Candidatus Binatus sp.]|uniref:TIGR03620 family F420-dependent LLM class oxidoreductase n=1 Tax=Candidatus Binatus sp. TaxID=2811406 RepID=UPI002B48DC69|nr:TIGR03620 family F420-dependent LLM class oxidoreductase [Candidatus Binatus sp.]HKN14469.1 TIGR03620 family F420-dependent LLM class oxidoreductase [Candidatus Binatus sp.]
MNLQTTGAFVFLDGMNGAETARFARKVERLGYSVLWITEGAGRETFTHAGFLLRSTDSLAVASGIANVFMREPSATIRAGRTLAELFEGRYILGLGVSGEAGNIYRGIPWEKPYTFMSEYLKKMHLTPHAAPAPKEDPPILLAAILPRMLRLAAAETHGTHSYFVPPEHTAWARKQIGPDRWLCAEQAVMLETDALKARTVARNYMNMYLRLPGSAYKKNLLAFGFEERDFGETLSDRVVDAIVAWGSEDTIRERIAAHYRAGATHVCILPLRSDGAFVPDERALEALAPK